MVSPEEILIALGYPDGTNFDWEPFGETPGSPARLIIGGGRHLDAVIREPFDDDAAMNHIAVSEALANAGYSFAPHLIATVGNATVEASLPGSTAMQFVPPPGSAEAAMRAFATLHALATREGLDWGRAPADLFPAGELPLHRLGFSSAEREPAQQPLVEAHEYLLASPFGFAHRNAVASNVVLAPGQAWLCDFSAAGFGPQLSDVAAFLLTSGIEAPGRRALAAAYANNRGLAADTTADLVDLLGILWGMHWLLDVPRKLITSLGDDATTSALRLTIARIDKGIRQAAGDSEVAERIRGALWPRES